MDGYIIGSGALLKSGSDATITPASFHAQVAPSLAASARAIAVDLDGTSATELRRLLLVAPGWNTAQFQTAVTEPLLTRGTCTLADVLRALAGATGAGEVHLFAAWLPDDALCAGLRRANVQLVAHALETIEQAALVSGQQYMRWNAPRAA